MSAKNQKVIAVAISVPVLLAVCYGAWRWRPANNPDHPEGTFWLCQNPSCNNEFVLSVREYAQFQEKHYGEAVVCPKCGKQQTIGAGQCPHCKRMYPRSIRGANALCPHCKKPLRSA